MLTNRLPRASRRTLGPLVFAGVLSLCATLFAAAAPAADAATWTPPVAVSGSGATAYDARLAVDPRGDAVAAWMHFTPSGFQVQAATRPAGGAWTAPVTVSTAGSEPEVAIDPAGDAIVVWQRYVTHFQVEASVHLAGAAAWSAPKALSDPAKESDEARVAVDPQGRPTVAWLGEDALGTAVVESSSAPSMSAGWSTPVQVSGSGSGAHTPELAVDGAGGAVAVWERPVGSVQVVQAADRPAGGAWGTPANLSAAGLSAKEPRLAVNADGDAAVVWEHSVGSAETVEATTRMAGGAWSVPLELSDPNGSASDPRIGLDGAGGAVAAWDQAAGEGFVVQSSAETAGSGVWTSAALISPISPEELEPSLAVDPAGGALMTIQVGEAGGEGETVQALTRLDAAGAWSSSTVISFPTDRATASVAGLDADGDAIALWRVHLGPTDDVIESSTLAAEHPAPEASSTGGDGTASTAAPTPTVVSTPKARCPRGKSLRKVKVRVPAKHGKPKFRTKSVMRCVKAKPKPKHRSHHAPRPGKHGRA